MIQVAIIHSQTIYSQGIALLLRRFEEVQIVAHVSDLRELVSSYPQAQIDLILWHIPNHHALPPGLRIVKENYPIAKILVLTETSNSVYSGLLVNLGASAVINSSADPEQLYQAIIALSQSVTPPPSSNHVQDPSMSWASSLSDRELQVLHLICDGYTDQGIAERLKISKRTVDGHRLKMRKKLQVTNTAMLVRVAVEKQLLNKKQSNISYDIL